MHAAIFRFFFYFTA
ncbi:TPA: pheST operon leader peptide PheM [Serratia marcescens]|nr:pheST operon leader peptide PheM [Serratia marcescens]HED1523062.1 pheST operon leader peptide PheM [Serratia marcescens]HED2340027.1 pheST operon leader peptide PheM [Serratia marcescens]HED2358348.1 pheST operon leader peptide PheM [Serratia marcescens]HED3026806.1 pheST operon leader peptide PheM [Serratia marcescens]